MLWIVRQTGFMHAPPVATYLLFLRSSVVHMIT